MRKIKNVLTILVIVAALVFALSLSVLAASIYTEAPYVGMLAFNQGGQGAGKPSNPQMSIIANLNIINLTPWNVFIGNPGSNNVFPGITASPFSASCIFGINNKSGASSAHYQSMKLPLNDPNNVWLTSGNIFTQHPGDESYLNQASTLAVPIWFNTDESGDQSGNTYGMNLVFTSSTGLGVYQNKPIQGDAYNNYPVVTQADVQGPVFTINSTSFLPPFTPHTGSPPNPTGLNVTEFIGLAAMAAGSAWVPANELFPAQDVMWPTYINMCAMVYPNFTQFVADGSTTPMDLGVILQSGDGAEISLIFVAVPHANNTMTRKALRK